jgi:5-methylcytosine-specific restriction endonuclease McrA
VSLRSCSDSTLPSRTRKLVRCERSMTLRVLVHLNEIEERKLHFKLGYRSMLHFCVEALGYARSSAGRRITAARCMKRFPEVLAMLDAGEANVVTIACVAGILTPDNKEEILGRIQGRTQEEVEAIVASYRPCEAWRDRVREVYVPVAAATQLPAALPSLAPAAVTALPVATTQAVATEPAQAPAGAQSHCETECKDSRAEATGEPARTEFERRVVLEFAVSKAFMGKLGRLRSLMWHRLPANATMEQVFELMLDQVLEQKDPAARRARREEREKRARANASPTHRARRQKRDKEGACSSPPRGQSHCETEYEDSPSRPSGNPRHIPARVRDEVFVRDKGRCAFVGRTGRKCGSTSGLQVDHIVPLARGGTAALGNLRLLCAWHNRLEAERLLGGCAPAMRGANIAGQRGRALMQE